MIALCSPARALSSAALLVAVGSGGRLPVSGIDSSDGHPLKPVLYELTLDLRGESSPTFGGEIEITARAMAAVDVLSLHATDLEIEHVAASSARSSLSVLDWSLANDLTVRLSRPLAPGESFRAVVRYRGTYQDRGGEGLSKSVDAGRVVISSQLQPAAARRVFPGIDHPCCPSRFRLAVITSARHHAFSNTPVQSRTSQGRDEVKTSFEPSPVIAPHLLALVAGDVDATAAGMHLSLAGPPRPIRVIAPAATPNHATRLGAMVDDLSSRLEEWLGLELPSRKLDVALVPGFRYFGMENPGLLVLRAEIVAWAARENRWSDLEELLAHELAHQWLGNQLAPARWRDIWISESLATWAVTQVTGPAEAQQLAHRVLAITEAERGLTPPLVPSYPMLEDHPAAIFTSSRYGAGAHLVDDLFEGSKDAGRTLGRVVAASVAGPITSQEMLRLLVEVGIDEARVNAFGESIRRAKPPLLEVDWRCHEEGSLVGLRWLRGRSPRPEVCVKVELAGGKLTTACSEGRAPLTSVSVDSCPELVLPLPESLGAAGWVYRDSGAYPHAFEHLPALSEGERLSLLGSLLVAVWNRHLGATPAAGLVGEELASSGSADGDPVRALVVESLAALAPFDGAAPDAGRQLFRSLVDAAGSCALAREQIEDRGPLTASLLALVDEEDVCRGALPVGEALDRSPEELRVLSTRRGETATPLWNEMTERLPTLPRESSLWLLRAPGEWPWEGREAADFLRTLIARRSSAWEELTPRELGRFLRAVVPERYWDDVASAFARTCSDATRDLVAGAEPFLEPTVVEQRDTALVAISQCLQVREAQH